MFARADASSSRIVSCCVAASSQVVRQTLSGAGENEDLDFRIHSCSLLLTGFCAVRRMRVPLRRPRWRHPELQPGWIDRPHQTLALGELQLESGEAIRDFEISYVAHGTRARGDDNVILVLTAIGSTHHRLDLLIVPGGRLIRRATHHLRRRDRTG